MKTQLFIIAFAAIHCQAQNVLTNQSILALDQAKASRSLIVDKINNNIFQFNVSTLGLPSLETANLPKSIVETMLAVTRPTDVMHPEEAIRLYQAELSRGLIIKKIQAGTTQFNVTTNGVVQLKTAKVPELMLRKACSISMHMGLRKKKTGTLFIASIEKGGFLRQVKSIKNLPKRLPFDLDMYTA